MEIEGIQKLLDDFAKLNDDLEKRILRKVIKEGGEVILEAVKEETPVLSGALKESEKLKMSSRKGNVTAKVIAGEGWSWYGGEVEFGHRVGKRIRKGGKKMKKINELLDVRKEVPANPFMERGEKKVEDRVIHTIVEKLKMEIEKCGQ